MARTHSAGTDGDTAAFRRITRGGVGWIAAGLALLALFGTWFAVMSYNGHLGDMVSAKASSYLQAAVGDVAQNASPLAGGRSPRVEVRAPPGPSYYVADFNNPADGLTYEVETRTLAMLNRESTLPLCRIIGLTITQDPGTHIDAHAVVQYAGLLGSLQTLTIGVSLADPRFKGPWGYAPASPPGQRPG